VVTAEGDINFTGIGSVSKLSGDKVRELREKSSFQSWDKVAAAPDGKLYFTASSAAGMADGLAWTEFPKEPFGGELLKDVAVDGKGQVWIAGTYNLWRRDGEAWTKISGTEAVGTDKPFFAAMATDGAGRLYVSSSEGLHVFDGTSWRALTKGRIGGFDELFVRSDGMVAASGGMDEVFVSVPGGQSLNLDAERLGLKAKRMDVVALDGAGRIWLDTDNGLALIDAKGNVTASWEPGTLPGVTGEITAVAVLGGGPEMPAAQAAITGAVIGKVLKAGQPVAGAPIEICESPSSMFRTTPCADASIKFQSTTGADGTFRFEGVPATKMGFTIKPGAQWVAFWGDSGCCAKLTAGGTYDVGAITLDD
jgi:ligand-binding sensor domain-containing protein